MKTEEECRKREEIQFLIIKTSFFHAKVEEQRRKREEIQSLKYVDADDNNKWEKMKKIEVVKEPNDVNICYILGGSTSLKYMDADGNNKRERMKKIEVVKESDEENVRCYSHCGSCRNCLSSAGGLLAGPSGITDVRPLVNGRSLEERSILSGKNYEETTEIFKNLILRLPFISTRGGIPNKKMIEGFLYGYKTEQQLKIFCICHGSFLTPTEFVMYAGGFDIENPLKHLDLHSVPL
ncbi:ninja-family protein AFP3-like [Capsicum chacoense]|uniref:ninja-family protein AFP3-like n=1 Tax=Capsicum annuum TaxID=4072 RepID=UPI001FB08517|nr:ninja-family protein AFP3-like [Capsicum annuum]KAF3616169.1 hypothetical protein FXO38_34721 [Capsicum annuum]